MISLNNLAFGEVNHARAYHGAITWMRNHPGGGIRGALSGQGW